MLIRSIQSQYPGRLNERILLSYEKRYSRGAVTAERLADMNDNAPDTFNSIPSEMQIAVKPKILDALKKTNFDGPDGEENLGFWSARPLVMVDFINELDD